jgi:hypothetical protein
MRKPGPSPIPALLRAHPYFHARMDLLLIN